MSQPTVTTENVAKVAKQYGITFKKEEGGLLVVIPGTDYGLHIERRESAVRGSWDAYEVWSMRFSREYASTQADAKAKAVALIVANFPHLQPAGVA